ncbi:hypothetical protein SLE2022_128240 [Rubroshorea leprosula]
MINLVAIFTTRMVASKPVIIKLTHRDSIHSPYYNPKESIIQRMENEIKTSADPFQALPPANDSIQFQIFPSDDKLFLANFSIGQPPIVQFAVMDSASGLLWIRCFPCSECSPQNVYPAYDRTKSSTYANLSCNSDYCKLSPYRWCNEDNSCGYKQGYVSGYSIGILATEQMMFLTSDEGIVFVPNVVFGCNLKSGGRLFDDQRATGILGLANRDTSIISRFGSRFSYCIGNMFDPNYAYNRLVLGSETDIEGDPTPLDIEGHYYVDLQGISVGEKRLDIDPIIFQRKMDADSGVIMDTGSKWTWLATEAYAKLEQEVENQLQMLSLTKYDAVPDRGLLCYLGKLSQDLIGFPVVTFHFAGEAQLSLDINSLFYQRSRNVFCMLVRPSDVGGWRMSEMTIIGVNAQQNYNLAYDIPGKMLYFQRIDCQVLDP